MIQQYIFDTIPTWWEEFHCTIQIEYQDYANFPYGGGLAVKSAMIYTEANGNGYGSGDSLSP